MTAPRIRFDILAALDNRPGDTYGHRRPHPPDIPDTGSPYHVESDARHFDPLRDSSRDT